MLVAEDFDFGELLIRNRLQAPGAIILFLPKSSPDERAARLMSAIASDGFEAEGRVTVISVRRIRQRPLLGGASSA